MKYDIIVIGAGPIGLIFARSLAETGLKIVIIEKKPLNKLAKPEYDGREIALAHFSYKILKRLEILDFIPLSNIDYAGGIIITDWYSEGTASNESVKITIRFLTTEVRADGIKIVVHKKKCTQQQNCTIQKVDSALESELQVAILRKAAIYEKEWLKKNKKSRPDLKD